jgi:flavin-dependent dehydrogenase
MDALRRFFKEVVAEGFVENKILKRTGGWIPAEGLLKVVRDRVMLVGDAGGFCHPITGGGIANAVLSGSMCADAILEGSPRDFEELSEDIFRRNPQKGKLKEKKAYERMGGLGR